MSKSSEKAIEQRWEDEHKREFARCIHDKHLLCIPCYDKAMLRAERKGMLKASEIAEGCDDHGIAESIRHEAEQL